MAETFTIPEINALLTSVASVQVEAQSKSALGAPVVTYSTLAASVPCRIEKLKADVAGTLYPKFDATRMYRVYFAGYPAKDSDGTAIPMDIATVTYQIVFTRSSGSTDVYQCVSCIDVDNLGLLLEVDVERLPY